jgi:hypothetical protein
VVGQAFLAHFHFATNTVIISSYYAQEVSLEHLYGPPSLQSTSAEFSHNLHDKISY